MGVRFAGAAVGGAAVRWARRLTGDELGEVAEPRGTRPVGEAAGRNLRRRGDEGGRVLARRPEGTARA